MNVRNAFSGDNRAIPNARSRSRTNRRRNASDASRTRTWFTNANTIPDSELREVVAQRFSSMNEAHDRIRTELLASRSIGTS